MSFLNFLDFLINFFEYYAIHFWEWTHSDSRYTYKHKSKVSLNFDNATNCMKMYTLLRNKHEYKRRVHFMSSRTISIKKFFFFHYFCNALYKCIFLKINFSSLFFVFFITWISSYSLHWNWKRSWKKSDCWNLVVVLVWPIKIRTQILHVWLIWLTIAVESRQTALMCPCTSHRMGMCSILYFATLYRFLTTYLFSKMQPQQNTWKIFTFVIYRFFFFKVQGQM